MGTNFRNNVIHINDDGKVSIFDITVGKIQTLFPHTVKRLFLPDTDWTTLPFLNKIRTQTRLSVHYHSIFRRRCDGQTSTLMDTTTLKRVVPLLVLFKRMAVAVEFMRGVAGANQDTDGKKRRSSMVISILAPKPRKVLPLLVHCTRSRIVLQQTKSSC